MKRKTREQKAIESYIDSNGSRCVYCKSKNIEGGDTEFDGSKIFQNCRCNACDKEWTETYSLTGVNLEEPIPEPPNSIRFIKSLRKGKTNEDTVNTLAKEK